MIFYLALDAAALEDLAALQKAGQAIHRWLQCLRHELHLQRVECIQALPDVLFADGKAGPVQPEEGRVSQNRLLVVVPSIPASELALLVGQVHGCTVLSGLAKDEAATPQLLGDSGRLV